MSKPHIIAINPSLSTSVHYYIDDIYIGSSVALKNGKLYKTVELIDFLNNPENVKKYLKTPIK